MGKKLNKINKMMNNLKNKEASVRLAADQLDDIKEIVEKELVA